MCSLMMALGSFAATSSISMPPAADAMNTRRPLVRSSTMPRYSSRAIGKRLFNQQPLNFLALGTGLVRDQVHPEHLGRQLAGFFRRLGYLDAATLAAAAGVDLCLDDDAGCTVAEQRLGRSRALLRGSRPCAHAARRHRTSRGWPFPGTHVFSCLYDCGERLTRCEWPDRPDLSAPYEDRVTVGNL